MSNCLFNELDQTRTAIPIINTWTALTLPVGARNAMISLELETATFRISFDNALNPSTQGSFVPESGIYMFEGTNTGTFTFYISASAVTDAIIQYSLG